MDTQELRPRPAPWVDNDDMESQSHVQVLYRYLNSTQRSLERSEKRSEELRAERCLLAQKLVEEGESLTAIGSVLGMSRQAVHKLLKSESCDVPAVEDA